MTIDRNVPSTQGVAVAFPLKLDALLDQIEVGGLARPSILAGLWHDPDLVLP